MAITTDYLGLTLPEGSNNADFSVLNTAFKKIESGIQAIDEWQYIGVYNFGSGADNEGVSQWNFSSINPEAVHGIRMQLDGVVFGSAWAPTVKVFGAVYATTLPGNTYFCDINNMKSFEKGNYSGYIDFKMLNNKYDARDRDTVMSRITGKAYLNNSVTEGLSSNLILTNGCGFSVAPTGGTLRIFAQTRPGV